MLLMPRCPLLQEPMGIFSSWVSGMLLILRLLLLWVCFLSSRCIIIIIHSRQIWIATRRQRQSMLAMIVIYHILCTQTRSPEQVFRTLLVSIYRLFTTDSRFLYLCHELIRVDNKTTKETGRVRHLPQSLARFN